MTSFSDSCRELMQIIDLTRSRSRRIRFRGIRRERLARARDEVASLKGFAKRIKYKSTILDKETTEAWDNLTKRIADLEAGIKILEGGR